MEFNAFLTRLQEVKNISLIETATAISFMNLFIIKYWTIKNICL